MEPVCYSQGPFKFGRSVSRRPEVGAHFGKFVPTRSGARVAEDLAVFSSGPSRGETLGGGEMPENSPKLPPPRGQRRLAHVAPGLQATCLLRAEPKRGFQDALSG